MALEFIRILLSTGVEHTVQHNTTEQNRTEQYSDTCYAVAYYLKLLRSLLRCGLLSHPKLLEIYISLKGQYGLGVSLRRGG